MTSISDVLNDLKNTTDYATLFQDISDSPVQKSGVSVNSSDDWNKLPKNSLQIISSWKGANAPKNQVINRENGLVLTIQAQNGLDQYVFTPRGTATRGEHGDWSFHNIQAAKDGGQNIVENNDTNLIDKVENELTENKQAARNNANAIASLASHGVGKAGAGLSVQSASTSDLNSLSLTGIYNVGDIASDSNTPDDLTKDDYPAYGIVETFDNDSNVSQTLYLTANEKDGNHAYNRFYRNDKNFHGWTTWADMTLAGEIRQGKSNNLNDYHMTGTYYFHNLMGVKYVPEMVADDYLLNNGDMPNVPQNANSVGILHVYNYGNAKYPVTIQMLYVDYGGTFEGFANQRKAGAAHDAPSNQLFIRSKASETNNGEWLDWTWVNNASVDTGSLANNGYFASTLADNFQLAQPLASNSDFYASLAANNYFGASEAANQDFTGTLAWDSYFTSELAENSNFAKSLAADNSSQAGGANGSVDVESVANNNDFDGTLAWNKSFLSNLGENPTLAASLMNASPKTLATNDTFTGALPWNPTFTQQLIDNTGFTGALPWNTEFTSQLADNTVFGNSLATNTNGGVGSSLASASNEISNLKSMVNSLASK